MDKKALLKTLIEENVFASSRTALQKKLRMNKNFFWYICKKTDDDEQIEKCRGKISDKQIENCWEKIRTVIGVPSDEEICDYAKGIEKGRDLWFFVQDQAKKQKKDERKLAEQTLRALLSRDVQCFSSLFSLEQDDECNRDFSKYFSKRDERHAVLIVMFFLLYNDQMDTYQKGQLKISVKLIKELYSVMLELESDNKRLEKLKTTVEEVNLPTDESNLWINTRSAVILIRYFLNPCEAIQTDVLRLLPIPPDSLWIDYEQALYGSSSLAYIFIKMDIDGKGGYICVEVEAFKKDPEIFNLKRCFCLCLKQSDQPFKVPELGILRYKTNEGFQNVFFAYRFHEREGEKRAFLEFAPLEDKNDSFFLPAKLHCIDDKTPLNAEERGWIKWFKKFIESNEKPLKKELMSLEGIVPFDKFEKYEILDVNISRYYLTVTIKKTTAEGSSTSKMRVELEKHPSLRHITPSMEVDVLRHKDDSQLYLHWEEPTFLSFPLSSFTEVK